jgi:hypothetical protein
MRRLRNRVAAQPAASVSQMTGSAASPGGTPTTMPLAQVIVGQPDNGYVTVAYRGCTPLWTTDGAAIPADAPGHWGQLAAAGRP